MWNGDPRLIFVPFVFGMIPIWRFCWRAWLNHQQRKWRYHCDSWMLSYLGPWLRAKSNLKQVQQHTRAEDFGKNQICTAVCAPTDSQCNLLRPQAALSCRYGGDITLAYFQRKIAGNLMSISRSSSNRFQASKASRMKVEWCSNVFKMLI